MARKPRPGPAADPELLILMSLAEGPKHGYAIMSDVEAATGTTLGPGTLYTAIGRLAEKKLVVADGVTGRQRPYRLTAAGAALLDRQPTDMRRIATLGLRRLRFA
jgi:DNA-binding PadR family transcriptional regulator